MKFTITPLGVLALRVWLEGEEEEGKPMSDKDALDKITEILSGKEWDSDTAVFIAEVVRATGRTIRDPEDAEAQRQRQAVKDTFRGMEGQ